MQQTITTTSAGRMRRARRSQNRSSENRPRPISREMIEVMRYPEITKNTSTPTKPPGNPAMPP